MAAGPTKNQLVSRGLVDEHKSLPSMVPALFHLSFSP